jgi:hypothetical protein
MKRRHQSNVGLTDSDMKKFKHVSARLESEALRSVVK